MKSRIIESKSGERNSGIGVVRFLKLGCLRSTEDESVGVVSVVVAVSVFAFSGVTSSFKGLEPTP